MSDTRRMLSARRCQYENPSLPKYIVPYEDAAQVEHELNQCRRELSTAKAEAEKWEKLHDQDTEHLVSLQKRDNYGPTETLNQTAVRLSRELDEMTARAISLSMHLPPQTLAGDVQNWRDEVLEEMNSLKRELARWRELPAKVEGLIPQTNIPLSAAQVRTNALYQVLDFIAAVKGGDK
jgi:hypothetical protein